MLDFTNTGSASCTLYGYPGVSLDNSGGRIGAAATRAHARPSALITLPPGGMANAPVQVADAQNYPTASCSPDSATFMMVYPPGETRAIDVPFKATGCRKSSASILSVQAVTSGAGNG